jgi:hypothetical protein
MELKRFSRKQFLNILGRYGILIVLTALTFILVFQRKTEPQEECDRNNACGQCSKRDNCKAIKTPPEEGLR